MLSEKEKKELKNKLNVQIKKCLDNDASFMTFYQEFVNQVKNKSEFILFLTK